MTRDSRPPSGDAAAPSHRAAPSAVAPSAPADEAAEPALRDRLRHMPSATVERIASFATPAPGTPPATRTAGAAPAAQAPTIPVRPGTELSRAISGSRRAFVAIGALSLVINLLMLTGSLFMLQVYDRVIPSGSIPTLVALSVMAAAMLAALGFLDLVRSRIVTRVGLQVDARISDRVFDASIRRGIAGEAQGSAVRELDHLRQFLSGQGPVAFCDAPWTPIYLLVLFALHIWIGVAASVGAVILLVLALASEMRSRAPLHEATRMAARSAELAEMAQRNAGALTAMGMTTAFRRRWQAMNAQSLAWQLGAADRLATIGSTSKALRLVLQSMMLALGAALAVAGEISAGSIVAASILAGRALLPVEQAIGHWRGFVRAREAYRQLARLLAEYPPEPPRTALPAPEGRLQVTGLRVAAPKTRMPILAGIDFAVEPGQVLAIIGPSASGKSTLARAIVGLWPALTGAVRIDGARLDQWDPEALGRHIGYLPQEVEIFAGTVRDNIARFSPDADDADVVAAAKAACAHDLVLALPHGYDTEIGAFGAHLSAGQRQRIGLARALYGDPALIVLDEPNANLDRTGDEALASAIDAARARGRTVLIVSHRLQAIAKADLVLCLDRGSQRAFGPRAAVLDALQQRTQPTAAMGGTR